MLVLVRNVDLTMGNVDIGGSGKSEIDPFGIPGFYGISEIDPVGIPGFYGIVTYLRRWKGNISHEMLTYEYWPMTSFIDFFLHVIRTLFQQIATYPIRLLLQL